MLKIRLSMGGAKKRPVYKIVVADSRFPRDGRFIEKLGSFNPLLPKEKKERIKIESERVKHWLSKGARPTVRVSRILGEVNIMPMPKPGNNPQKAIPFKDKNYEYWTKTTVEGNYSIKLRKKIGTNNIEEIWNGDKEKEKLKTEYFGLGDLEVSWNDQYLGYSLDLKGSEYYTIYIRDIKTGSLVTEKIIDTSGGITFSLDDKFVLYI